MGSFSIRYLRDQARAYMSLLSLTSHDSYPPVLHDGEDGEFLVVSPALRNIDARQDEATKLLARSIGVAHCPSELAFAEPYPGEEMSLTTYVHDRVLLAFDRWILPQGTKFYHRAAEHCLLEQM